MISVVVPVRNDPGRLRECLSGLLHSSQPAQEIIVVDDASTDATAEVAEELGVSLIRLERNSGPGVARNHGARAAQGEILVFVDADVRVHEDTLARFSKAFSEPPFPDAVFGAYDVSPTEPGLVSQYKNLSHHFVHRESAGEATTFWAGCGAVRRAVFLELGGFNPFFDRPSIEDIELGVRLHRSGRRILLVPEIQATHLKRWTLFGLLRSDIWDRAVPWTELILRDRRLPSTLNLTTAQRASAVLAWTAFGAVVVASTFRPLAATLPLLLLVFLSAADAVSRPGARLRRLLASLVVAAVLIALAAAISTLGSWVVVIAAPILVLVMLNTPFYRFLLRLRGPVFALLAAPLHLVYFACAGLGFGLGTFREMTGLGRSGVEREAACRAFQAGYLGLSSGYPMSPPDTVSPRARAALGSLFQIAARLGALLLGLVLMAYLTRRLGVAEYGRYAVAMVVMQWLSITIGLATGGATVRLVAGQPRGERYAATMVQMVALLAGGVGLLVAVCSQAIAAALRSPGLEPLLQILSAELALGAVAGVYSGILVAQGRFRLSAVVVLAGAAAQLIAAFYLVGRGWLAAGACSAALFGSAVQLGIGRAGSGIRILTRDRVGFAHLWGHTRLLAAAQAALRLTQTMDLLAVKFFTESVVPAGYYAGANNIGLAGMALFTPANGIVLQSIAQSRRDGQPHEAARTGEVFVRAALAYGALLCALSVLADDIAIFLLGPAFAESTPILVVLLWAVAFRTVAATGRTLVNAVGERVSAVLPLLTLVAIGIVAYAILIPRGGIMAAAWVALGLAVGGAHTSLREGLSLLGLSFPWRTLGRVVAAGVVAALVAQALPGTGAVVLAKLTVACVAYGAMLIALKEWRPDRAEVGALWSSIRGV